MELSDRNYVILWTNRVRCALSTNILYLLNEESWSLKYDSNFFLTTNIYSYNMIKKTFTINEKNKDLGLLKKVRKQEKLRGDFWFWKLFWESWELFSARHEHSISVPDSTSLNHCITDKTLQRLFIHVSSLIKALVSILLVLKIHYQKENPFIMY